MNERRYCTFHVDKLLLGIDIERVQEVLADQTITPVPLADPDVAGLLNLRGQIVTTVDARRRLGLTERGGGGTAPTIVVIRSSGEAVSLLVDHEGDVVDVEEHRVVEVPETVGAGIAALAVGAYKLEGALLLVLDADQMVAVAS
jgi:purine-binding chemotaxis protein CheW